MESAKSVGALFEPASVSGPMEICPAPSSNSRAVMLAKPVRSAKFSTKELRFWIERVNVPVLVAPEYAFSVNVRVCPA